MRKYKRGKFKMSDIYDDYYHYYDYYYECDDSYYRLGGDYYVEYDKVYITDSLGNEIGYCVHDKVIYERRRKLEKIKEL
jgi:hypothetical protein